MKFIRITTDTLDHGAAVFNDYSRAAICGREDRAGHAASKQRRGGLTALPGAAIACFGSGLLDQHAAACAISRATRCRRSTVDAFLAAFLGRPDETGTYGEASGYILEQNLLSSATIITA